MHVHVNIHTRLDTHESHKHLNKPTHTRIDMYTRITDTYTHTHTHTHLDSRIRTDIYTPTHEKPTHILI